MRQNEYMELCPKELKYLVIPKETKKKETEAGEKPGKYGILEGEERAFQEGGVFNRI